MIPDDWSVPCLLGFGPSQERGCVWEQWMLNGVVIDFHYEPDGTVDAYLDAGDWDHLMDGLDDRQRAFDWVRALTEEH